MNLDHDSRLAVRDAVALVNTVDGQTGHDALTTESELAALIDEWGVSGHRAGTSAELHAVRQLRSRMRAVFDKAAGSDHDGVIDGLNRLIAETGAVPQLVEHDGIPAHLHYTPSDAPLDQRLGAEEGVALAIVIRDGGVDRLRVCEAPDCENVFVDLSRNRSRRFCSTQCGNRQNVAAYRQRQAHTGP